MKEYIIWLDSGESVNGSMEDAEAYRLKTMFLQGSKGRANFKDTEGEMLIDMSRVITIALNRPVKNKSPGFTNES